MPIPAPMPTPECAASGAGFALHARCELQKWQAVRDLASSLGEEPPRAGDPRLTVLQQLAEREVARLTAKEECRMQNEETPEL